MKKYLLFTPGPTPIPEEVVLAMSHPIFHHRTKDFEKIFGKVREGLKWLYGTTSEVLIYAASGTGAMESSMVNLFSPGDKVIYVNGGKFGERWGKIGKKYNLEMVEIPVTSGEAVTLEEVEKTLKAHPSAKGLLVQACETSTGVAHPIEGIAKLTASFPETVLVVDAITALGVWDLPMDAWGIDVLITGSQKALMLPPGLSFLSASPKAWSAQKKAKLPRYYFDWASEEKSQQQNTSAYTPAVSLIMGLEKVLELLQKEGRENIFARHREMAELARKLALGMGLEIFAKSPASGLTTLKAPENIPSSKIISHLQNKYGMVIANGQDELKDKIFRIAHMGYFTRADILEVMAALKETLEHLGFSKNSAV